MECMDVVRAWMLETHATKQHKEVAILTKTLIDFLGLVHHAHGPNSTIMFNQATGYITIACRMKKDPLLRIMTGSVCEITGLTSSNKSQTFWFDFSSLDAKFVLAVKNPIRVVAKSQNYPTMIIEILEEEEEEKDE